MINNNFILTCKNQAKEACDRSECFLDNILITARKAAAKQLQLRKLL